MPKGECGRPRIEGETRPRVVGRDANHSGRCDGRGFLAVMGRAYGRVAIMSWKWIFFCPSLSEQLGWCVWRLAKDICIASRE